MDNSRSLYKNFLIMFLGLLAPSLFLLFQISQTSFAFDLNAAKSVAKTAMQWGFGEHKDWYLWVNVGVIIFPFLLSFDKKVAFYKQWGFLLPAVLVNAAFFIAWDVYYTALGVWGFNERYISGLYWGLPAGEWLFFITVPYACVFVHQCLNDYFPNDTLARWDKPITWASLLVLLAVGLLCYDKIYTAWAFLLSAGALGAHYWYFPNTYRTRFYRAYVVCLLPFLITNGILTGAVNQEPVVLYNDAHNLTSWIGSRFITIPYDDFAYGFLLLFVPIFIYEELRGGKR